MPDKQLVLQSVLVKLSDIKPCKWNPPGRISEKNLSGLIDSIEQFFVPLPIILTHEMESLEGNRRVESLRRLGYTHVPAIILPEDFPQEHIYSLLTTHVRKHTPNEKLYVWLHEPRAVTVKFDQKMKDIEKKIGRKLLEKIYASGLSTRTYYTARRVASYCQDETAEFVKKTVNWLISQRSNGIIGAVSYLITEEGNEKKLTQAIANNQELR